MVRIANAKVGLEDFFVALTGRAMPELLDAIRKAKRRHSSRLRRLVGGALARPRTI